jgi:tetratricopeptide (TPR) repeat protein
MTWLEKAVAHHQAGELQAAERLYDKVLKVERNNSDALNLKGIIASAGGRHKHAISFFERAASARPSFADPHFNKALALAALGRSEEALASYADAVRIKPTYGDARLNLGLLLFTLGRKDEAIAAFRAMTETCPLDARGFYNLGVSLEKSLPSADEARRDAIADESAAAFNRALALNPGNPDIHYSFSNLHSFRGNYREAAAHLETALRLRPHWPDAWNNLANQVEALGDREAALAMFERALAQDPANAGAFVNRGMTCLALGRLAEGWEGYARRFDDPRFPFTPRNWPWPKWRGEDLRGKSILLWGDQGVGDEILYSSMIPEIAARAAVCVVECEPRLLALYRRSFPTLEIVSVRGALAESPLANRSFDFQCSVLDLGAALRRSFAAFPIRAGLLRADAESSGRLRQKYLHQNPDHRLIGISWRSINPGMTHQKSLSLSDFEPLFRLPKATFVNLQYGSVTQEIGALRETRGIAVVEDPTVNPLVDLEGFAAQVRACDAVVTVSNTTVHFAGALDVPAALLVPDGRKRQWYWFDKGGFSPWYRSVRLFRAPAADAIHTLYKCFST